MPLAWFIFVESKFQLQGIVAETDKFDLEVSSLLKETMMYWRALMLLCSICL
jgi:hypothetical protein